MKPEGFQPIQNRGGMEMMKKTSRVLTVCLILMFVHVCSVSAEDEWEFIIAPYGLFPTITGDASVGIVEGADIDVGADDIFNNLELGGMMQAEAHHKSGFGIILAYNFMDLEGESSDPNGNELYDADVYQGIFEGYGVYRYDTSLGPVEGYGGIRWWSMDIDFSLRGTKITDNDADWIDPVIGIRWRPQLSKRWSLIFRGDLGGFGVGSDFTWNLQGGIAWSATEYMSVVAEYRAISVDYSDGPVGSRDRFAYDTVTHGPVLGLAFRF